MTSFSRTRLITALALLTSTSVLVFGWLGWRWYQERQGSPEVAIDRLTQTAAVIAREIGARDEFNGWSEFGRITVNVDTAYRTLDPAYVTPNVVEQFRRMAELEGFVPH